MIPTPEELKNEWGQERYCKALGEVVKFSLLYMGKEIPFDALAELSQRNEDAFEIFASKTYHGSKGEQKWLKK